MTVEEYLNAPETVLPQELAFGVLRVADAPRASHQRVVLELLLALAPFVRSACVRGRQRYGCVNAR